MGFFNKLLKGLGFEDDEEYESKPSKKVKEKKDKEKSKPVFASFDLNKEDVDLTENNIKEELVENKEEDIVPEIVSNSSLNIIKVQNQVEVQNVVNKIKNGEQVIINMSTLSSSDLTRSLDFLTGAVFALDKSMQKVDTAIFIIQ